MATQPIPLGTSDITVYGKDPLDGQFKTYGYFYANGTDIRENRGDAFIGAFGTGDSTYQDAEPFKRRVWTNWNGGMGQVSADHKEGGSGNGGDDSKYFDGSVFTKKGNILMPGIARKSRVQPQQNFNSPLLDFTYVQENMISQIPAPVSHPAGSLNKFTITNGILDTYTRANGAIGSSETTGGYPSQNYSAVQGTWVVSSNKATSSTDANLDMVTITAISGGHPDYEMSVDMSGTVVNTTNFRRPVACTRVNSNNYLQVYFSNNLCWVDKVIGGVGTNLTNFAFSLADGVTVTVKLVTIGNQFQLFVNGAGSPNYTYTITDAVLMTGTSVGFKMHKGGTPATIMTFDNLLVNPIIKTIRILAKVDDQFNSNTSFTIGLGQTTAANSSTYSGGQNSTVDFKWTNLTCSDAKGYTTLTPGNWYLRVSYNPNVIIGGYIGPIDGNQNVLIPYWQYVPGNNLGLTEVSGVTGLLGVYRLWSQTYTMYVNAFVTPNAVYGHNMNAIGTVGGLLGISTTVDCAVVFDNTLYISTANNCYKLSADDIHDANTATAIAGTMRYTSGQMIAGNGKIYGTDGSAIFKYDPSQAVAAGINPALIISSTQAGSTTSNGRNRINKIFFYRGLLYIFKPDGVFMAYADPDKITSNGSTRIERIVNFAALGIDDVNNGKYVVEYQGQLVFNVMDDVWLLSPGSNGNNISTISPPLVRSNGLFLSYIDGIITNGQEMYISVQNFGIWIYDGSWHRVAYYYDGNTPSSRGLSYIPPDPTAIAAPQIYYMDGYSVYYQYVPSTANGSYLKQIYKNDQAKFSYWISSLETMDLAEVTKYIHSWTIKAASQGFNIKVVGALYQAGSGQPNFRRITEQAFNQGLWRDTWSNSNTVAPYRVSDLSALAYPVVVPGSCYFTDSDFANEKSVAEKTVSADYVQFPTTIVQCQFIVYMWKSDGVQVDSNNLYTEIAYIDAMVLKFLPILDYIPLYHVTVDAQVLNDDGSLSVADTNDSFRFLREMSKSRTPIKFQFYDHSGSVKTVVGYMQNPVFTTDAITVVEGDPPAKTCQFDILSIQGEPVN